MVDKTLALKDEAILEFRDLVWAYHRKGLNFRQLWEIVHDLEMNVTTEVIGEVVCETKQIPQKP